jgi:hypothetical protein
MHHIETLARRIVDEVDTVTAKVPVRWVTVQQIARRLRIHHSSAIAAVRLAVDRGWPPPRAASLTVFAGPTATASVPPRAARLAARSTLRSVKDATATSGEGAGAGLSLPVARLAAPSGTPVRRGRFASLYQPLTISRSQKGIDQSKGMPRSRPLPSPRRLLAGTTTLTPSYNALGAALPFVRCPLGVYREDNK